MNDMGISLKLLDAAAATPTEWTTIQRPGRYCFAVAGTFGGCSVGLEMLGPDGTTAIAIEDEAGAIALTAAGARAVLLPPGQYRATITGGTSVSMHASIDRATD